MGEVLLNQGGKGRFRGYSAGSRPKGDVHPLTLTLLRGLQLPTEGLRSKSWEEFARPGSPKMDFVFTVCDQAAAETCPIWPGQPMTAHWGIPDPASVQGSDVEKINAFRDAYRRLDTRIKLFVALPLDKLERMGLKREVDRIGRLQSGADEDAAS
jgi:arsenate reductase